MKKIRPGLPAFALAAALLTGCPQKPPGPAPLNPESARVFDTTAAHLDSGGDFYVYLRTEQVLQRVPAEMDAWKDALLAAAGDSLPMPREQVEAWYALAKKAVLDSGLTQLRALGMSTIEMEPGLSRMKSFAYSGELAQRGLLWRLSGTNAPHPFAALDFLPASTAYAAFSDFDAKALWDFVQTILNEIPDPELKSKAQALPAMAQLALGAPLPELLGSLGTEFGFVVTTDDQKKMRLPLGAQPLELPLAQAALLVAVKDDRIYDIIVDRLRMVAQGTKSDADGLRMMTVQVPAGDLPLRPTVARFGNYLVLSTTDDLVKQLADRTPGRPRMVDTPAFQRFARLEKLEGNSFGYLSEAGSRLLRETQMAPMKSETNFPPALRSQLEKFYDLFSQRFLFSIGRVEKDGCSSTVYSPDMTRQIVATISLAPAAVLASVAVPATQNAMRRAEATSCLAELRALDAVMKSYEMANAVEKDMLIRPKDLEPYIPSTTSLGKRLRAEPFVDLKGNVYPEMVAGYPPRVAPGTAAAFVSETRSGFWGVYFVPEN